MGRHSKVGKGELGPYIRGKDDSYSKKGYTSRPSGPEADIATQCEKLSTTSRNGGMRKAPRWGQQTFIY